MTRLAVPFPSSLLGIGCFLAIGLAAGSGTAAAGPAQAQRDHGLGALIERKLRADGPFFDAAERAAIERACGYGSGQWDGFSINARDDVLICANGRRVDDPEIRRMLAAAAPRIDARVRRVMNDPEVKAAMAAIGERAEAAARRALDDRRQRR